MKAWVTAPLGVPTVTGTVGFKVALSVTLEHFVYNIPLKCKIPQSLSGKLCQHALTCNITHTDTDLAIQGFWETLDFLAGGWLDKPVAQ